MNKYIAHFIFLICSLSTSGCFAKQASVTGVLLDKDSGNPVAGAYIVVRWEGDIAHFPSSYTKCIHVQIAKTDSGGLFDLPPWELGRAIIPNSLRPYWVAIRPGYDVTASDFQPANDKKYFLKRSSGSSEDWIRAVLLKSGKAACEVGGEDAKAEQKFFDELARDIEQIPGGDKPISLNEASIRPKEFIHQRKCLSLWRATEVDFPERKNAREVYDQCLKQP